MAGTATATGVNGSLRLNGLIDCVKFAEPGRACGTFTPERQSVIADRSYSTEAMERGTAVSNSQPEEVNIVTDVGAFLGAQS